MAMTPAIMLIRNTVMPTGLPWPIMVLTSYVKEKKPLHTADNSNHTVAHTTRNKFFNRFIQSLHSFHVSMDHTQPFTSAKRPPAPQIKKTVRENHRRPKSKGWGLIRTGQDCLSWSSCCQQVMLNRSPIAINVLNNIYFFNFHC